MRDPISGNFFLSDKSAIQLLNTEPIYSLYEAYNSFQMDINCRKKWSYRGYSKLWGWNRGKVKRFVDALLSPSGLKRVGQKVLKKPIHILLDGYKDAHNSNEPATNQQRTSNEPPKSLNGCENPEAMNQQRTSNEPAIDPTIDTETNTNTNTSKGTQKTKSVYQSIIELKPFYFSLDQWKELYNHRTKKKAAQTVRAYNNLIREFDKAIAMDMTADDILNYMSSGKGWSGFKLEWVTNSSENGRNGKTLEEFGKMMGELNANINSGQITTGNGTGTVGALGLPLPQ